LDKPAAAKIPVYPTNAFGVISSVSPGNFDCPQKNRRASW
jgi:hypothetical protein